MNTEIEIKTKKLLSELNEHDFSGCSVEIKDKCYWIALHAADSSAPLSNENREWALNELEKFLETIKSDHVAGITKVQT